MLNKLFVKKLINIILKVKDLLISNYKWENHKSHKDSHQYPVT